MMQVTEIVAMFRALSAEQKAAFFALVAADKSFPDDVREIAKFAARPINQ